MFRSRIIPAAMVAVMAMGAAGTVFAESGEHENSKEVTAVLGAKTSVAQAIAAAEQKTGGRAMKVDVEKQKGAYLYEVKTVSNDTVANVLVDPSTGQVVNTENEGFIAKVFDREDKAEFAKLAAAPTTLAAAIATAEQHTGGKAIEASFDNENGAMLFKIEVAKDNAVHRVAVDSATGNVTKVSATEDGEHED